MTFSSRVQSAWKVLRLAILPLIVVSVTASLGMLFHVRGERVVESLLREHMLSSISLAVMQIDGEMVERVRGPADIDTPAYRTLVEQLRAMRDNASHVRFAYIMRKTADPSVLAFVADADALSSLEEIDVNGNDIVDPDEEPGLPGDLYSPDEGDELLGVAFLTPIVDDEFTVDQWGRLLSAYAPITDDQGEVVAVVGMDMQADEFLNMTQNTFSIVAVLLVTLVGVILAIYVLTIIRMRHVEALKQVDDERTALMDLATHQLGMPLATFKWWLEILKERDGGKFCREGEVCDQLQEGVNRMDSIIRALHEASQLQSNIVSSQPSKTSASSVIKAVAQTMQSTYGLKKQTIKLSVARNLPHVNLDRKLLAGLLHELLENASAYSPLKADVSLAARPARNGVQITVSDKGCGIPEEDLPHVFEKFRRGANASRYKPVGNGLGLFIVRQIVEKVKGKIDVRSELNKGTSVIVFLPAA